MQAHSIPIYFFGEIFFISSFSGEIFFWGYFFFAFNLCVCVICKTGFLHKIPQKVNHLSFRKLKLLKLKMFTFPLENVCWEKSKLKRNLRLANLKIWVEMLLNWGYCGIHSFGNYITLMFNKMSIWRSMLYLKLAITKIFDQSLPSLIQQSFLMDRVLLV